MQEVCALCLGNPSEWLQQAFARKCLAPAISISFYFSVSSPVSSSLEPLLKRIATS